MTVFIVLTVLVMLNLLISLLNELYEILKQQAKADWCRQQAVQLYKFDERKQNAKLLRAALFRRPVPTPSTPGGGTPASKPLRPDSYDAENQFGLSRALSIKVQGPTSYEEAVVCVPEPEETDHHDVHPTKRLQQLQQRASRVGRAYFGDDGGMHTVVPLLKALKVKLVFPQHFDAMLVVLCGCAHTPTMIRHG